MLTPTGFWRGSRDRLFLNKIEKNEKNDVQETGWTKTWFVDGFLMPKWEAWYGTDEVFAGYLLQRDLGGQENLSKKGCQKSSTSNWKASLGRSEVRFFSFWTVLENIAFLIIFARPKIDWKLKICGPMGGKRCQAGVLWRGRRKGWGPLRSWIKR